MHSSSSKESSGDICWVRLRCELIVAIFLLTGVTGATQTQAQSLELQQLTASDAAQGNFFGSAVAVSGDTAVVGARYADCTPGDNCGSAYIYRFNGTSWVEEQKLIAPETTLGYGFGKAVAIIGDTAIVGAGGSCALGNYCGSAHVYQFNGTEWIRTQKLTASDAAAIDSFGVSLSMSGDKVIIGAIGVDCTGPYSDCGAAYIFRFDGTAWVEEQKLIASDIADHDRFGGPVSLSGNTAVVGANEADCAAGIDCGAAYVFHFDGNSWVEVQKLTASDMAPRVEFGESVSVFQDTIMVGAPVDGCAVIGSAHLACGSAYVFRYDGTTWVEVQKLFASDPEATALFGAGVVVDGEMAILSAPQKDCTAGIYCGAAYLFHYDGTSWVESLKLAATDRITDDNFGITVALRGDVAVMGGVRGGCASGYCGEAYIVNDLLRIGVPGPIPAVSTWGLLCLTLLTLTSGTIAIRRVA